jgi:cytochrome c oxidase assembly protein subunit 11
MDPDCFTGTREVMMSDQIESKGTRRLVTRLFLIVGGMFAFGFALVPLYDVICDITGLNGKTAGRYAVEESQLVVQSDRKVTVQFTAHNNAGMDWEFRPSVSQVVVSPGEVMVISYKARNPNTYAMTGQAIPSVAPNVAAAYLNKIECFCFQEQKLEPGEEVDMALRFFVDANIPERVTKLTLSYSLFDITSYESAGSELASN